MESTRSNFAAAVRRMLTSRRFDELSDWYLIMNNLELVELKYCSKASRDMGIKGLMQILDVSIASNKRHNITGVLIFEKGRFGQILEGPRGAIEETWVKIQKDTRHSDIVFLGIMEIKERKFPDWALKLFDDQKFASAFPEFSAAMGQIGDVDQEALNAMAALWFPD